ncbi:MAG: hypothetical protein EAX95_06040 [Candidatus Thorarchaeota archaeon]|nr:hypothetical protein [Candidatus Thorarchaeota archaeon]
MLNICCIRLLYTCVCKDSVSDKLTSQGDSKPKTARAFVPGHITGIFRIHDGHENPLFRGSVGAGFSVAVGTVTNVRISKHSKLQIRVQYNRKEINAPVTSAVIRRLLNDHIPFKVEVAHESSLPIGVGFGASGAGALGTALALSSLLDDETSVQSAGVHAHFAEVVNHTGLGDVIAQCNGGFEARRKPGAPGIGEVVKIPYDESKRVVLAGHSGLETKEILTNPVKRERINSVGDEILEGFLENPTFDAFLAAAKEFSKKTQLMTSRIESSLLELQSSGFNDSSMVMLGDSVFCFCDESETISVSDILSKYWTKNQIMVTSVCPEGGRLI